MEDTDRRNVLGRLVQVAPVLALVAIAGFALGACGGGENGALSTQTGLTRTTPTRTTPTRTTPTRTVTTSETTTETATTAETTTETTATTAETTTVPLVIPPATTTGESSSSSTPWGWIALGLALAAALVIGLVVWQRHRAGAAEWGAETADLNRRCLVALDDVLAKGSVVTGQIEALAAEAQAFEARAPDDPSRAAAARVREGLNDLAGSLEADRTLRLGSPPPSAEQLSDSTALIRQQVEQRQRVLRPPSPMTRPG